MIEIKATLRGKEVIFRFRPMTPAETALWGSKLRARFTLLESLKKQIELMGKEPLDTRDIAKQLVLEDKKAVVFNEVVALSGSLSEWCVEPSSDEVKKMMGELELVGPVTETFLSYLGHLLPSPDEQKKS